METIKIQWVDHLKGLGIILVVAGHTDINPYLKSIIYSFHMPLFFFLSGYLYKGESGLKAYFIKKSIHLLLPYISFFFIVNYWIFIFAIKLLSDTDNSNQLLPSILKGISKLFCGGRYLDGNDSLFWFINVLFLTQQIYHVIYLKLGDSITLRNLIILSYIISIIDSYYLNDINFPWSIDVVFATLPYFYIGHYYAGKKEEMKRLSNIFILLFVISVPLSVYCNDVVFNMRGSSYGIPICSFIASLGGIYLFVFLSEIISKYPFFNFIAEFGKASMIILYLHLMIFIGLNRFLTAKSCFIIIFSGLIIPYLCYLIIIRFVLLRLLLCGQTGNNNYLSVRTDNKCNHSFDTGLGK
ncbi:MAG: acyltransferase family protein [bacterium]|nr:acyltransferase family protein [bacterium]